MKFLAFLFPNTKASPKTSGFSDFFRSAPSEKKMKILNEAAKKANEEQQQIVAKSQLKTRAK